MMEALLLFAALILAGTIAAGLVRIARGPTPADRMLATLLFGTTGVATLLLLSRALSMPEAVDVALLFALLAPIVGIAFASLKENAADGRRPRP